MTEPSPASANSNSWEMWREALQPIPTLVKWYKANAISGTLLLAAFVIAKGYVLARGSITTALGMVQYVGAASVVVAAVLSSLPLLAASVLALSGYSNMCPPRASEKPAVPWRYRVTVGVCAFVLCAALAPWPFTLGAVILGALFGLMQRSITYLKNHPESSSARVTISHSITLWATRVAIGIGVTYAVFAMLYTVWLPREVVSFKPGKGAGHPVVAYILAEDPGGRITLLDSNTRQIERYLDESVSGTSYCQPVPRGGWSDITSAPTLWAELTNWLKLSPLRPVDATACPAGQELLPGWLKTTISHVWAFLVAISIHRGA